MKTNNHFYAVIVAGGSGKRMGNVIPKQFMLLNGIPVLMHTLNAFYTNEYQPQIILVLPESEDFFWQQLIAKHHFKVPHQIIYGGTERFHSVKSALSIITDSNSIIAIHDGVRPLVSQKTISNCFQSALAKGNAIAAIPAKDSIRKVKNNQSEALNRSEIYLVQTPQTFIFEQLRNAYKQEYSINFTDDASVVEKAGFPIHIENGDEFNFKITFKEDLIIAEALLKSNI
ncbi:2-C-methyl-D-erythritol 4-phosphate cytidylyltransferase [Pedobacter cryophilus]|uniref:2-C-methyl-D-erythritol 4-phosphate cytidylyltransferase n=1 Tax=Pedobacter cryophilus TaxID=2571271 RepID=A0A4U1BUB8_9SPHI|nr:2-C-methyl-D-erythritol 4-phosphate cytidylyltransferase [Pedobacter cryophilus]TKB95948.1 2-C-methyl-D-erythritol 4-phosphate cytidylyltransferase [Pedobacter cryophilus]